MMRPRDQGTKGLRVRGIKGLKGCGAELLKDARAGRFVSGRGLLALFAAFIIFCATASAREIPQYEFRSQDRWVRVAVLSNTLVHFEYGMGELPAKGAPIRTSPMIARRAHDGPSTLEFKPDGYADTDILLGAGEIKPRAGIPVINTDGVRLEVDPETLCLNLFHGICGDELTLDHLATVCPESIGEDGNAFTILAPEMTHAYGLGAQFVSPGGADGDWVGRVREPGCEFGNRMVPFAGGAVGNAMFPMLYMLGEQDLTCGLFLDDLTAQKWDFSQWPWTFTNTGNGVRGFLLAGESLGEIRQQYMNLVGRPPVPPRSAFGLWVSEYGYDNWAEMDDKLRTLREKKFPVDGFVLDLQWFGGIDPGGESSRMGRLAWDEERFSNPRKKTAELRKRDGIGLILIEESYVSRGLAEHKRLARKGYLVKQRDGSPSFIKSWWGHGGMIDWTNPDAADDWHDRKRQPLVRDGVAGHWTDLGEPEDYDAEAMYFGLPGGGDNDHAAVHNYYNFAWVESIHRGYARNSARQRPFIMSRSGTSGIQRFGTALWSGDIASNMPSLAAHYNVQMHMAMSGVDYFGADVGGFKREKLDGDLDELYTQWLAAACAIDVPVRPHTANTKNKYETAPDRVGDTASNLANLRRRYELIPYLYSLAHRAHRYGEPVFPPPVYHFQNDSAARKLGAQKMIGDALMTALAAEHGRKSLDVYLPSGTWFCWHTGHRIRSEGQWVRDVPIYRDGLFTLPMYARAGAIIPLMHVDDQTLNSAGQRRDGIRRDELILRVFEDDRGGEFTLYEDDGWSNAYLDGEVRTTRLTQNSDADGVDLVIHPAKGRYAGAPRERVVVVRLTTNGRPQCVSVAVNGRALSRVSSCTDFEAAAEGWYQSGRFEIEVRCGPSSVRRDTRIRFALTAD